jgi:putative peptidoglycan lipid II flippase
VQLEQTNTKLKRLVRNERATVASATLVTMTLIGLSRITGIIRDIGRTTLFGRDWHTDAYVSAFSIPDLIYFLASGGALSAGFVPVFTGYLTKGEDEKAMRTFRVLMTYLGLLLLSLIVAFEVLAPQLVALLFPGMVGDEQKFTLTVRLVRILLPAQFFFVLGSLFTGALWSLRYFAEPQVQSVLYNLFILFGGILGAQFCAHWLGKGIEGMAIGALTGAAVGAGLVQARKLWQVGMDFRPCFDWRDEGARQVLKLVIPVVFSLSVTQINAIILPRSFSSLLPHGAATAVEMANRIMQLPVALFGASVGIALFPTLSALATKEAIDDLRRQVASGLRTVLFMTVPTAVLMAVLREPIVALFFEYGRWKSSDTQATALALLFYSFRRPCNVVPASFGEGLLCVARHLDTCLGWAFEFRSGFHPQCRIGPFATATRRFGVSLLNFGLVQHHLVGNFAPQAAERVGRVRFPEIDCLALAIFCSNGTCRNFLALISANRWRRWAAFACQFANAYWRDSVPCPHVPLKFA